MKEQGIAAAPADHFQAIDLPKNTGSGVLFGASSLLFGFAMVWHIAWLAATGLLSMLAIIIGRSADDDTEYRLTSVEIGLLEEERFRLAAEAGRAQNIDAHGSEPNSTSAHSV